MEERIQRIREIGEVLAEGTISFNYAQVCGCLLHLSLLYDVGNIEFEGETSNLIKMANKSAVRLVSLVTRYFPGIYLLEIF